MTEQNKAMYMEITKMFFGNNPDLETEIYYYIIFTDYTAIACIIFGILVIISKNPVVSIMYLIGLFLLMGSYLILVEMPFIGLSYYLVYIGAIAILFLFIIMLLDIKSSELVNINQSSKLIGIILTLLSINFIFYVLPQSIETIKYLTEPEPDNFFAIYNLSWETRFTRMSHVSIIGNLMYNYYMIWLFIVGFILLVALIGAILLIKKKN